MNYPDILEEEEAFKSTATVAALATANRTGAPTPPTRGRGGAGIRDRGRGVGATPRGRGNQNRGRGGGQPQPRHYHGPTHHRGRGQNAVRFMSVINPHAAHFPRPPQQTLAVHRQHTTAPRHHHPSAGPSSTVHNPPAGPSSTVHNPPAQTGPIQISSESDSDDDEAPYYGGCGRCYRCSKSCHEA